MLALSDEALRRFTGVASDGAIVLLGPPDALPWFDGALYLGAQGGLLVPTWAEPDVHPTLLEKALRRALPKVPAGPLAVLMRGLGEQPVVVSLAAALPLSRDKLGALR